MDLASLFKCLSDSTRLRIVNLLLQSRLCVCEIQESLQEPQVKMSKHLGYMKKNGLLTVTRKANWNFYDIAPDLPQPIRATLEVIETDGSRDPQWEADSRRLKKIKAAGCR